MVQPVSIPAVVPGTMEIVVNSWEGGFRWIPEGWATNPVFDAVRADRTAVSSSGTPQAFALSLADVVHLSTEAGPFPNHAQRVGARQSFWWLRTSANVNPNPPFAWHIYFGPDRAGELHGGAYHVNVSNSFGGVRPAIIIHR